MDEKVYALISELESLCASSAPPVIRSPSDVFGLLISQYGSEEQEVFLVITPAYQLSACLKELYQTGKLQFVNEKISLEGRMIINRELRLLSEKTFAKKDQIKQAKEEELRPCSLRKLFEMTDGRERFSKWATRILNKYGITDALKVKEQLKETGRPSLDYRITEKQFQRIQDELPQKYPMSA